MKFKEITKESIKSTCGKVVKITNKNLQEVKPFGRVMQFHSKAKLLSDNNSFGFSTTAMRDFQISLFSMLNTKV